MHVVHPAKYSHLTILFLSQLTIYDYHYIKMISFENHTYGKKTPVNIFIYAEHFIIFSSVYSHAASKKHDKQRPILTERINVFSGGPTLGMAAPLWVSYGIYIDIYI